MDRLESSLLLRIFLHLPACHLVLIDLSAARFGAPRDALTTPRSGLKFLTLTEEVRDWIYRELTLNSPTSAVATDPDSTQVSFAPLIVAAMDPDCLESRKDDPKDGWRS